jgi:hypothetical protein
MCACVWIVVILCIYMCACVCIRVAVVVFKVLASMGITNGNSSFYASSLSGQISV